MTTHSSIHTWKIPWTEKTCWLSLMGLQRFGQHLVTEQMSNRALKKKGVFGGGGSERGFCHHGTLILLEKIQNKYPHEYMIQLMSATCITMK